MSNDINRQKQKGPTLFIYLQLTRFRPQTELEESPPWNNLITLPGEEVARCARNPLIWEHTCLEGTEVNNVGS